LPTLASWSSEAANLAETILIHHAEEAGGGPGRTNHCFSGVCSSSVNS
jgi:hypothetical protein